MTFEFFTPGYPAICREAGAEFILYDMEHSGVGFETMKAQFAFCRGLDLVPLVRVPSGDYHHIARALDIGAMGIMVPMVETPEQAKAIVDCTKYPPQGVAVPRSMSRRTMTIRPAPRPTRSSRQTRAPW